MSKQRIQKFWSDNYRQLYAENDASLTPKILEQQIDELEDLFRIREQSCVVEMPLKELSGKKVLEIGSGAGGHSCIFKRHGGDVTAVDITWERVISTATKLCMLKGGSGQAIQADAGLPKADERYDGREGPAVPPLWFVGRKQLYSPLCGFYPLPQPVMQFGARGPTSYGEQLTRCP